VVDIAASAGGGPADGILAYAAVRSIRHHAREVAVPEATAPAAWRAGLQPYREMCAICHGGPGAESAAFAAGLHPPALDLTSPTVQAFSDAMLYETISRGIGSTGMPAFRPTLSVREIWNIVAFLRHLTTLSPEDQRQLGESAASSTPRSGSQAPAAIPGTEGARVHDVTITGFKFDPAVLEVNAGDVIVWTNTDLVAHTATADDGAFDTGKVEGTRSGRVVAATRGTFPYSCHYHPAMKGTLTVR
jgi:plastocyanin